LIIGNQNLAKDAPMSTNLRRITITLPIDVDVALVAMSKAEGRPQAKIVTDCLTEFVPVMVQVAKFHQQIKNGKKIDAKQTIQHMFGDAMASLLEPEINSKIENK
jgi:hypothetical protein